MVADFSFSTIPDGLLPDAWRRCFKFKHGVQNRHFGITKYTMTFIMGAKILALQPSSCAT
jgi:hypothetical protein